MHPDDKWQTKSQIEENTREYLMLGTVLQLIILCRFLMEANSSSNA